MLTTSRLVSPPPEPHAQSVENAPIASTVVHRIGFERDMRIGLRQPSGNCREPRIERVSGSTPLNQSGMPHSSCRHVVMSSWRLSRGADPPARSSGLRRRRLRLSRRRA